MTQVVVPLAGPDFVDAHGRTKADWIIDGEPLLLRALNTRPWANRIPPANYLFIMLDRDETRDLASERLSRWYPGARVVFLSQPTRGAAISSLAGMTSFASLAEPLIVDLADILYDSSLDPEAQFASDPTLGGIGLTFESSAPVYSYFKCDASGEFVEAAEKRVISSHASAGTYLFSNTAVFLRAVAHAMENEATQAYNNLLYVCPLFNGVRAQEKRVNLSPVSNIVDVKTMDAQHGG